MRKISVLLGLFLATTVAMATGEGAAAPSIIIFTPAIAMALAAGLCGIGQGKAICAACEGIARNPAAAGNIRTTLIIGLALIESLALYTLAIALIKY